MSLNKEIPIRKLNDETTNYYPLSVGESVVTTSKIYVRNNIGGYNRGDIIPSVTTLRSILETLLSVESGNDIDIDNKTIIFDENYCICVNIDGDTLYYDPETNKIKINDNIFATKDYVNTSINNLTDNLASKQYVRDSVSEAISELPTHQDVTDEISNAINNLATKQDVDTINNLINNLPTYQDVTDTVYNAISELPTEQDISDMISSSISELPTHQDVIDSITDAINELPTEQDISDMISSSVSELPTHQDVTDAISSSVSELPTFQDITDAISDATTDLVNQQYVDGKDTELKNYVDNLFAEITYKKISITGFTNNIGTVSPTTATNTSREKGNKITSNVTFAITLSKKASKLVFTPPTSMGSAFEIVPDNYSTEATITNGDYTYSILKNSDTSITIKLILANTGRYISSNTTWKIKATESSYPPSQAQPYTTADSSTSVSFYWRVFYGVKPLPPVTNEQFIETLSSSIRSGKGYTDLSLTAGTDQYMWYCVPTSYGTCSFRDRGTGFGAAFENPITVSVENDYEQTTDYYVYRSTYANLGNIHLDIT